MLNKYPVIPEHFILATRAFKEQTHLLEEDDLAAVLACLQAWRLGDGPHSKRKLFAFFNSGEHSGASQSHRHVQFLPVEDMARGLADDEWDPLIDKLSNQSGKCLSLLQSIVCASPMKANDSEDNKLPFLNFHRPLAPNIEPSTLHKLYISLYERAVAAVHRYEDRGDANGVVHGIREGAAAISYNLALTTSAMMLCPRRQEVAPLKGSNQQGEPLGVVNVNGTILAGTLMVKSPEQWDTLRSNASMLDGILADVGYPPDIDSGSTDVKL